MTTGCSAPSELRIIRRASFRTTPWKNGGGVTHEAIREPADGDAFRWRVSVAHIDASGPFSDFAGYKRKMVLLQGDGIELRFGDGSSRALRQVGDLAEFDGAVSTHCELLNGACVDLNLMVAWSDAAAVRVERFIESLAVKAVGRETLLVFGLDRRFTLELTTGKAATLEPWDLAVLSHASGRLHAPESANPAESTAVFLATL
jgi:environmental stress-induced protein Ves